MEKNTFPQKQKSLKYNELFDLWLEYKSVKVRSSTLAIYRCHIKSHLSPLPGNIPIDSMNENALNRLCFYGLKNRSDRRGELSAKSKIDLIRTFNNFKGYELAGVYGMEGFLYSFEHKKTGLSTCFFIGRGYH